MASLPLPGNQPAKLPHPQVIRFRASTRDLADAPWDGFGTILFYEDVPAAALIAAGLIDKAWLPGKAFDAVQITRQSVIYRNRGGNVMAILDAAKTARRTPGFGAFMLTALSAVGV